jgi:hypothetical protein
MQQKFFFCTNAKNMFFVVIFSFYVKHGIKKKETIFIMFFLSLPIMKIKNNCLIFLWCYPFNLF